MTDYTVLHRAFEFIHWLVPLSAAIAVFHDDTAAAGTGTASSCGAGGLRPPHCPSGSQCLDRRDQQQMEQCSAAVRELVNALVRYLISLSMAQAAWCHQSCCLSFVPHGPQVTDASEAVLH